MVLAIAEEASAPVAKDTAGTVGTGDVSVVDQIDDVSLVVPENELLYSIILIRAGKKKYLIPFSYKKEACDAIYSHLMARVTVKDLEAEIAAEAGNTANDDSDGEEN